MITVKKAAPAESIVIIYEPQSFREQEAVKGYLTGGVVFPQPTVTVVKPEIDEDDRSPKRLTNLLRIEQPITLRGKEGLYLQGFEHVITSLFLYIARGNNNPIGVEHHVAKGTVVSMGTLEDPSHMKDVATMVETAKTVLHLEDRPIVTSF
jgi:hypothetical protein